MQSQATSSQIVFDTHNHTQKIRSLLELQEGENLRGQICYAKNQDLVAVLIDDDVQAKLHGMVIESANERNYPKTKQRSPTAYVKGK